MRITLVLPIAGIKLAHVITGSRGRETGASGRADTRVPITIVFVNSQDGSWAEPLVDALRGHGYHVLLTATVREAEVLADLLGLASLDLVITTIQLYAHDQAGEASALHPPCILISAAPPPDRLVPPVVWWLATPLTPDILLAAVRDTLHSEGKGCTR